MSTIQNAARRDKQFAQQLRRSEMTAEVGLLRNLREASSRSWRAAAWQLEHLNPQRYARRRADYLTFQEVEQVVLAFGSELCRFVPAGKASQRFVGRLQALLTDARDLAARETAHDRRQLAVEVFGSEAKLRA